MEIKKKWTSVDSRKLAGLGKDVETFMMNKIMNIGITTQEETEEVERTEKEIKVKTHHICTDYLLTKLIWWEKRFLMIKTQRGNEKKKENMILWIIQNYEIYDF